MKTILDSMGHDHEVILDEIESLQQAFEENTVTESMKDRFRWLLENHFLTEEKSILLWYKPHDDDVGKAFDTVIEQHRLIREKLEKLDTIRDFMLLRQMLLQHRGYEDSELYPRLDADLDSSTQQQIINRIEKSIKKR